MQSQTDLVAEQCLMPLEAMFQDVFHVGCTATFRPSGDEVRGGSDLLPREVIKKCGVGCPCRCHHMIQRLGSWMQTLCSDPSWRARVGAGEGRGLR